MTKVKNKEPLTIEDLQKAGVKVTKGSEYGLEKFVRGKSSSLSEVRKTFSKAGIKLSEEIIKMREEE